MMIRPTLRDDLHEVGFEMYHTFRGVTAVDESGKVHGVAGVMYSNPPQCVSWISDELRGHKRAIVKAIWKLRRILNGFSTTVYALAQQDEPTAEGFIRHVGFEETEKEGIFKWPIQ